MVPVLRQGRRAIVRSGNEVGLRGYHTYALSNNSRCIIQPSARSRSPFAFVSLLAFGLDVEPAVARARLLYHLWIQLLTIVFRAGQLLAARISCVIAARGYPSMRCLQLEVMTVFLSALHGHLPRLMYSQRPGNLILSVTRGSSIRMQSLDAVDASHYDAVDQYARIF